LGCCKFWWTEHAALEPREKSRRPIIALCKKLQLDVMCCFPSHIHSAGPIICLRRNIIEDATITDPRLRYNCAFVKGLISAVFGNYQAIGWDFVSHGIELAPVVSSTMTA
jgi:hypothetical protein